jgi:hypothetical protein
MRNIGRPLNGSLKVRRGRAPVATKTLEDESDPRVRRLELISAAASDGRLTAAVAEQAELPALPPLRQPMVVTAAQGCVR